jgi:hypothetical protein
MPGKERKHRTASDDFSVTRTLPGPPGFSLTLTEEQFLILKELVRQMVSLQVLHRTPSDTLH